MGDDQDSHNAYYKLGLILIIITNLECRSSMRRSIPTIIYAFTFHIILSLSTIADCVPEHLLTSNPNTSAIKTIIIKNSSHVIPVMNATSHEILSNFTTQSKARSCSMPDLFIYEDYSHDHYSIFTTNVLLTEIKGGYFPVNSTIYCPVGSTHCEAVVNNGCQEGTGKLNWVTVATQDQHDSFQYLVNCSPTQFYKPFEWGLFILIFICTIAILFSSFYSRAWSLGGFGIPINGLFLVVFNGLVIAGSVIAYYFTTVASLALKIIGSGMGIVGVGLCVSEILWLGKNRFLNSAILYRIRPLDIVAYSLGVGMVMLYWFLNGAWIANDIIAVCSIVAGVKIFKIRSLKIGVIMLFSMLIIEIIAGLIVHYILKVSYNNWIIKLFESPLVIVFPSITPEIYRRCAWLPITSIIFPGLLISYLRRFDKARGTFLYILIGYFSFQVGSLLWMIADMNTRHALPLAIISDPVTIAIVFFFANRRNEFATIWDGTFFDPELPDFSEELLPSRKNFTSGRSSVVFQQLTDDLKISPGSEEI